MIEATLVPARRRSQLHLGWVVPAFVYPRETFARIAAETRSIWITPLLLVSLATLMYIATAGWLRSIAAASGQPQLPADFQYYPPEMQAQIMQALQATTGPVFLYVFPALLSLATIWVGWLLLGGLLHLTLTLLGGRGSIGTTLNLVAWAGLPIILRDLVRVIAMLSTRQLISYPGLSGFTPDGSGANAIFLLELMKLMDIYLVWTVILLVIGTRAAGGLSTEKAILGVLLSILIGIALEAAIATGVGYLSSLTISRPFMF